MLVDAGRLYMLKVITGQITPEPLKLGLYTGTPTWTRSTVLADLSEAAWSGYVRQNLSAWSAPVSLAGGEGSTTGGTTAFANTSGADVTAKGFFYVTATTSVFLGGDAFATPLVIPATVGTLSVTPELRDSTYP